MTMSVEGTEGLPRPGEIFEGKYRIERLIGKGGMGAVLGAHHEMLDQKVAIKFLLGDIASNPEAVRRFQNEGKAAAKIKGEHVCQVTDVGVSQTGLPYMVMELLDGMDLSQVLEQRGPLGVEEAVDYVLQALEAIAQAHGKGIVHRDLKPANLFLARREDGMNVIKVLDFGISKASNPFSQTGNHSLTSTKSMLGSPLYMSPEQLRSAKNVDARADIWSIGVILFELLTGRVPFNGESLGELFVSILESQTPRVSQFRGDVPQILDEALLRCLQKPLDARFSNVAELAQALAPCAPARAQVSVERIFSTLNKGGPESYVASAPRPPLPSHTGALTGSHSGVKATLPLAQSGSGQHPTMQSPSTSTQDAWGQATQSAPLQASTPSKTPLILGAAAAVVVLFGIGGGVLYAMNGKKDTTEVPPSATVTSAKPPESTTASTHDTAPTSTQSAVPSPADSGSVAAVTSATPKSTTKPSGTGASTKPPASTATAATTAPATTTPAATAPVSTGFDPTKVGRH